LDGVKRALVYTAVQNSGRRGFLGGVGGRRS
jgi:hypothetical protein